MKKEYFFSIYFGRLGKLIGEVYIVNGNKQGAYKKAIEYAKSKIKVEYVGEDECADRHNNKQI